MVNKANPAHLPKSNTMNIRAITVSVDYADLLAHSLELWRDTTDSLLVITTDRDTDTRRLCEKHRVQTYVTDVFYANGAVFNKGAAMSEAVLKTGWRRYGADWLLTFDADIIPPKDWRSRLEKMRMGLDGFDPVALLDSGNMRKFIDNGVILQKDTIYGAYRWYCPENMDLQPAPQRMPQGFVIGFFNLFHNSSPYLPPETEPLWDCHWPHAGNVDTLFMRRFPPDKRVILPLKMVHLGEERKNWCGRYNRPALAEILKKRRAAEDWERERMANPPEIK